MSPLEFTGRWRRFFLRLARENAQMSKDPSTKVGCVIVRPDRTVASMGFNGLPRSMADRIEVLENRELKYRRIIHAEVNALLIARERLDGYAIFVWPAPPCDRCMVQIAQAGIRTVYAPVPTADYLSRWQDAYDHMRGIAQDAGVRLYFTLDDLDG